jgi:GDPmannose 4,6-dehydratase
MRSAIVVGHHGQDGRLLTGQLRADGVPTLGIGRGTIDPSGVTWNRTVDITRAAEVAAVVGALRPDALFHLAALHESSEETPTFDLDAIRARYEVNFFSLLHCLEAIRVVSPATRLFFAASSHIFGAPDTEVQDEETPLRPDSVYGMTKADGLLACRLYRARHRLHASVGILYTHESPHRDAKFLAMKIARAARRIRAGRPEPLVIGDLDAVIDWGWAPDYVDAMRRIVALDAPGEFVIATGERRTVRDFLDAAFGAVGLDWRPHVREDAGILARPGRPRVGNAARLRAATGWAPTLGFEEIARRLVADRTPGDGSADGSAPPG